jgi:hypothetical protein
MAKLPLDKNVSKDKMGKSQFLIVFSPKYFLKTETSAVFSVF